MSLCLSRVIKSAVRLDLCGLKGHAVYLWHHVYIWDVLSADFSPHTHTHTAWWDDGWGADWERRWNAHWDRARAHVTGVRRGQHLQLCLYVPFSSFPSKCIHYTSAANNTVTSKRHKLMLWIVLSWMLSLTADNVKTHWMIACLNCHIVLLMTDWAQHPVLRHVWPSCFLCIILLNRSHGNKTFVFTDTLSLVIKLRLNKSFSWAPREPGLCCDLNLVEKKSLHLLTIN